MAAPLVAALVGDSAIQQGLVSRATGYLCARLFVEQPHNGPLNKQYTALFSRLHAIVTGFTTGPRKFKQLLSIRL